LNPLIVNSGAPDTIPINCFMSAADDFEFSSPIECQPEITNPALIAVDEAGKIEVPGDIVEGEDLIVKPTSNILSHGSGVVVSPFKFQSGESNMNIKNLIRRFGILDVQTLNATPPVFPQIQLYTVPVIPTNYFTIGSTNADNRAQNLFCYISQFYLFWKGSVRYKLFSNVSKNAQLMVFVTHNTSRITNSTTLANNSFRYGAFSYASAAINFSHVPCVEVEVPYYSPFSQMLNFNYGFYTRQPIEAFTNSCLEYQFSSTADTIFPVVAGATVFHFSAAGDDFVLNFYLGPLIFVTGLGTFPGS
jgi:hypothetical protein